MDLCRCLANGFYSDVCAMSDSGAPISDHVVEQWIGRVLRAGVWGSATLIIIGLILVWALGVDIPLPNENPSPNDVLGRMVSGSFDPFTLIFAGLILLMLTPFLRVLAAAIGFAVEKDRPFTIVSLVIFAMLIGELIYSLN